MKSVVSVGGMCVMMLLAGRAAAGLSDPFAPPANYYSGVSGTGPTLKTQLGSAMTAGHIERNYGDFRSSAAIHDQDPDNPTRILLCYNRASVPATWDAGSTWNREHVWPQSLQPGSASNSTRGALGDPHALLPANPSINSSRGNKPFGFAATTGDHRSLGSFYFPGDMDKGDIARILFYMDTRWGPSLGLALVDGAASGFQMSGLSDAVAWHYIDPPDTFERRRNHAIFSQTLNPLFYTNNRNAFVDMPEAVWSVYVDQQNDSTLWVGPSPDADGSSIEGIAISILVSTPAPTVDIDLNKSGQDGTYFSVTPSPGLTSSISGRHNAFPIGSNGTTRTISIGVDPSLLAQSGVYDESIVIDNLDLTQQGGMGKGANDGDDVIAVEVAVFDPAVASLDDGSVITETVIDLGTIAPNSGDAVGWFDFFNLAPAATGAPMDIEWISASGDTGTFAIDFQPVSSLQPESGVIVTAMMDDAGIGTFEAVYTFAAYNDRGLFAEPGPAQELVVRLVGEVSGSCAPDLAEPFGTLNIFDLMAYINLYNAQDPSADLAAPFGALNIFDITAYIDAYGAGCP